MIKRKIMAYLKTRRGEGLVTVSAICIMLGVQKSSVSRILRELELEGLVEQVRITTKGRGQPTLGFRWRK